MLEVRGQTSTSPGPARGISMSPISITFSARPPFSYQPASIVILQRRLASTGARARRSPSGLLMSGELLDKKIPEDFDALRSRPSGRRHPVDGTKLNRPIRQHFLQPAGGECLA